MRVAVFLFLNPLIKLQYVTFRIVALKDAGAVHVVERHNDIDSFAYQPIMERIDITHFYVGYAVVAKNYVIFGNLRIEHSEMHVT